MQFLSASILTTTYRTRNALLQFVGWLMLFKLVSPFSSFHRSRNHKCSTLTVMPMWKGSETASSMRDDETGHNPQYHDSHHHHHGRRQVEFLNLEPVSETDARRARMDRDIENRAQFVKYGDELWDLRDTIQELSSELIQCMQQSGDDNHHHHNNNNIRHEEMIRDKLFRAKQRDPELVYKLAMQAADIAQSNGRMKDAALHLDRAKAARCCLPQFNLDGLWVGKYGNHGYEMINITYHGDVMTAVKVTGDQNVPRGEITFQVDLSPLSPHRSTPSSSAFPSRNGMDDFMPLKPIALTSKAATKWGTRLLPRYRGVGQVAESGFENNQWMDGQLIIIGDQYFSFAWVPIEHQIFFGRPSAELALKMLRSGGGVTLQAKSVWETPPSLQDDPSLLKEYASHCLEMTTEVMEDHWRGGDAFGCIWQGTDTDECYFE